MTAIVVSASTYSMLTCHVLCVANRNPSIEEQAMDRVHRLGQTRDVEVSCVSYNLYACF